LEPLIRPTSSGSIGHVTCTSPWPLAKRRGSYCRADCMPP